MGKVIKFPERNESMKQKIARIRTNIEKINKLMEEYRNEVPSKSNINVD